MGFRNFNRSFLSSVFVSLFFLSSISSARLGRRYVTGDMNDLVARVEQAIEQHGSDRVLVVFDMDNTLLAMKQSLGSDQWFDWQADLLKKHPESPALVAKDFGGLLTVQYTLFSLGQMRLTQPDLPSVNQKLRSMGVSQMVLSSRGPETRDVSLRELKRNGLRFDFNNTSVVEQYVPIDLQNPEKSCLKAEEVESFKIKEVRPISVGMGVVLSSGLHKGAILRSLLCKVPDKYKVVLFADDKLTNIVNMENAYIQEQTLLDTFHYTREEKVVAEFHQSEKKEVKTQWDLLKGVFTMIFVQ